MSGVFKRARSLLGKPAPETPLVPKRASKAYHGVSIRPGPQACAGAQALASKRYLSHEVPILPLKTCDQEQCSCRYAHHEDRRKGPRRATEIGIAVDLFDGDDKRVNVKRGRRKNDT